MTMDSTTKKLTALGVGIGVLAVIVLMFLALVSEYGYTLREDTTAAYNDITLAVNGTKTDFGSTYPYVQDVTSCINSSNGSLTLSSALYTVKEGSGDNGGLVLLDTGAVWSTEKVNCSVSYKADTSASSLASVFITAIGVIGSFAAVIILAFMGQLIYKMFND